jgi:hypothetical protein
MLRKPKVVNETLPTKYWGLTRPQKAASQAGFENRANIFFTLKPGNGGVGFSSAASLSP